MLARMRSASFCLSSSLSWTLGDVILRIRGRRWISCKMVFSARQSHYAALHRNCKLVPQCSTDETELPKPSTLEDPRTTLSQKGRRKCLAGPSFVLPGEANDYQAQLDMKAPDQQLLTRVKSLLKLATYPSMQNVTKRERWRWKPSWEFGHNLLDMLTWKCNENVMIASIIQKSDAATRGGFNK